MEAVKMEWIMMAWSMLATTWICWWTWRGDQTSNKILDCWLDQLSASEDRHEDYLSLQCGDKVNQLLTEQIQDRVISTADKSLSIMEADLVTREIAIENKLHSYLNKPQKEDTWNGYEANSL